MNTTDLMATLINGAGLTLEDIEKGSKIQRQEFRNVLIALSQINAGKGNHYGDYIENAKQADLTPRMILSQVHSEVRRKWVRLDKLLKDSIETELLADVKFDLIFDTLADLGVYAPMMIDLINSTLNPTASE